MHSSRFEIRAIPTPDEKRSPFPPELWGTTSWTLSLKVGEHVQIEWKRAPEGFVVLCRCRCGGHKELLCDIRGSNDNWKVDTDRIITELIGPVMEVFSETHAHCAEHELQFELASDILRFINYLREDMIEGISHGDIMPRISFLFKDRIVFMPLREFPNPDRPNEERRMYFAALQSSLRDYFRAVGVTPTAAVFASTGWMARRETIEGPPPSEDPNRQEVAVIALSTPTYMRFGNAVITREIPGDESSSGTLAPFEWINGGESRVIEGLLALTDILPQDDETKLQALGVSVFSSEDEV